MSRRYQHAYQGTVAVANPTSPTNDLLIFPWGHEKIVNPSPSESGFTFPSYFRPVTSVFPNSKEVMDNAGVPLGISICPAQAANVPVLDYSNSTVVRCSKCAGYLSPYVKASADMKDYTCPMCGTRNLIPTSQFDTVAFNQRIEVTHPVYDIVAPKGYIAMPYACATYIFMVDLSLPAVSSGFTTQFLTSAKASIASLPENSRVSIMTISDSISIFDIKNHTEFVVGDITDLPPIFPYIPMLSEARDAINEAFEELLNRSPSPGATGHCLGSGLSVAEKYMTPTGGVLFVGCYGIPTIGPYAITNRTLTVTNSEADLLRLPGNDPSKFYREISFKLNRAGITVNLFAASDSTSDFAIIAVPCGLTGGTAKYYGKFDAEKSASLHIDLFTCITTKYLWNCSLRLRCTDGIKMSRPQGTFSIQNRDLLSIPVLDPKHSVFFELTVEKTLTAPFALFQLALLWTTSEQKRMIRVFTFTQSLTSSIASIRSSIDEGSLSALLTKKCVIECLTSGPIISLQNLKKEVSKLSCIGAPFVSLYHLSHAIACSDILKQVHPLGVDGRVASLVNFRASSIIDTILAIYPRLFALDTHKGPLPLLNESFSEGYVLMVHMQNSIFIWVNQSTPIEYINALFGVSDIMAVPSSLPVIQTDENAYVQSMINDCWTLSGCYLPVEIILQGSPKEALFSDILVDSSSTTHSGLGVWLAEVKPLSH